MSIEESPSAVAKGANADRSGRTDMNEDFGTEFDGRDSTDDGKDGIEVLDVDSCLRLLRDSSVGCLGMPSVGAPELRPVNFIVDGPSLIIRTGEGQILEAGRKGLSASFLVYGIDPLEHTGWSVSINGKLSQLDTNERTLSLHLRPWASGQKDRFVKLFLSQISGRAIPAGRGNR
jgi:hypothetical protein